MTQTTTTTTTMNKHFSIFIGLVTLSSFLFTFEPTNAFMQSRLHVVNTNNRSSSSSSRNTSKLFGYIAADSTDEEFDVKQGGVGLAQDNAIVLVGRVDNKGNAVVTDMERYTALTEVGAADGALDSTISVVCRGTGTELYQNPGLGTDKVITLAPYGAVAQAIEDCAAGAGAGTTDGAKKISINFAGGDDLMVHEVLESVQSLVSSLELKSCSIEFRSLCHDSFPLDKCSVAVLAFQGGSSDVTENVYWHEGQWWTLLEDNLNTAIE